MTLLATMPPPLSKKHESPDTVVPRSPPPAPLEEVQDPFDEAQEVGEAVAGAKIPLPTLSFKNDGSFMEQFKRMQEEAAENKKAQEAEGRALKVSPAPARTQINMRVTHTTTRWLTTLLVW